jgi:hypothetical protein
MLRWMALRLVQLQEVCCLPLNLLLSQCRLQHSSMAHSFAFLLALSSLAAMCQALHPDFAVRWDAVCSGALHAPVRKAVESNEALVCTTQASMSETPVERRRRLKVEAILPTDPGQDGIAIGLDGKIYSDTAITDAVAQVGQLGPLNPKVALCHFPPQERAQFQVGARCPRRADTHGARCWCLGQQLSPAAQVKYLEVVPLVAAQLVKKGDFLAPSYPNHKYGYGCVLYDHVCDFSTQGAWLCCCRAASCPACLMQSQA